MSPAEPKDPLPQHPQGDAQPRRAGTGDAAFDLLFQQLENGGGGGDGEGGASQVFSVAAPNAPQPAVQTGAFRPAEPHLSQSGAPAREAPAPRPQGLEIGNAAALHRPAAEEPAAPTQRVEPAAEPGEFTRIFTQLPKPQSAPPPILAESRPAPTGPPPAAPGEFTQFFQALSPAPPAAATPSPAAGPSPAAAAPLATPVPARQTHEAAPPRAPSSAQPPPENQAGAFTAFFEPASTPGGSATKPQPFRHETFAERDLSASGAPAAAQATPPAAAFGEPARTQPHSGGFTELMQSLGPAPTSADRAPAVFAPLPPPAPQPAAPTAAGEFTQLMQSLEAPRGPAATPAPPAPPGAAPFFQDREVAFSGPSEFTRVLQSSAARSAETAVPAFAPAPQPAGGASVGLPISAPRPGPPALPKLEPPAPPVAAAKTTLQAMMPWLLAANGLLLALLVLLAVLFLRHRH